MARSLVRALAVLASATLMTTLAPTVVAAGSTGGTEGAAVALSCGELTGYRVPGEQIGMPTNGAVVTSATPVAGAGGPYCRVAGAIAPVDPTAPDIRFQIDLPATWSGKAMMFGGGGYNGAIPRTDGQVIAGPTAGATPLSKGYATFASDSGHQAGPAGTRDGSFARNDEALRNFAGDALKKTHDTAMEVMRAHYGTEPALTYFAGGSTGGREALLAVSTWPEDFEGAIVLFPAWNAASLNLKAGQMTRQLAEPGAYPNRQERGALLAASMQTCDGLDGVEDGLISNVAACDDEFDPMKARVGDDKLRCPGGKDTGDHCLSDQQIASFEAMDSPLTLPYRLASGERGYPGFTTWGTDFGIPSTHPLQPIVNDLAWGTKQPSHPMPPVNAVFDNPPYAATFWDEWAKHFVTGDPAFNSLSLDPRRPGVWQSRIVELTGIQDANETDLSAFADRGGKIVMAHGSHDALVSNRASQLYVQRLEDEMGVEAVQDFLRYYEIPGYGHALSTQFNAEWDSLTALEGWVERGVEPTGQVVADHVGVVGGRTRPLCEFPSWPEYVGGDVNAATSFTCSTR